MTNAKQAAVEVQKIFLKWYTPDTVDPNGPGQSADKIAAIIQQAIDSAVKEAASKEMDFMLRHFPSYAAYPDWKQWCRFRIVEIRANERLRHE